MTEAEELNKLFPSYAPGQAWLEAKIALAKGDVATAEALLPNMLPSDQDLMRELIFDAKQKGAV